MDGIITRLDNIEVKVNNLEVSVQHNDNRIGDLTIQIENGDRLVTQKFVVLTARVVELEEKLKKMADLPAKVEPLEDIPNKVTQLEEDGDKTLIMLVQQR